MDNFININEKNYLITGEHEVQIANLWRLCWTNRCTLSRELKDFHTKEVGKFEPHVTDGVIAENPRHWRSAPLYYDVLDATYIIREAPNNRLNAMRPSGVMRLIVWSESMQEAVKAYEKSDWPICQKLRKIAIEQGIHER